jgi:subtilisin family serine protease
MTRHRGWLLVLLCLCVAACARVERESDAYDGHSTQGQLLVMLRVPAPHFRPDASYASSYGSRIGQDARRRLAEGIATQYGLEVADEWPMPALGIDCFVMRAPANASLAHLIEQLSADPRVESAQPVNLFKVLAHNDPLYPLQPSATEWHLSDLHRIATGKRVRVAQVDTGVESDHPDLIGQIALAQNFVDGSPNVPETHGTAVAGIIAAKPDNGIGIAGIAPDATFLALRACWETVGRGMQASCSSFTLAKALQFALEENAQVINVSVGGPRDQLLERLLDVALHRGITVVGAADPNLGDGGFPASHHGVLAIAEEGGQDSAGDYLAAPGQDIPTTLPGRKWGIVSGSSFAAAHVTGLVALLRELSPDLQPQQLREALGSRELSSPATDHSRIVDACAAVARTAGTCACACTAARRAGLQGQ